MEHKTYHFQLNYPADYAPASVDQVLRKLLIPRKWRHYLRIEKQVQINGQYRNFNELVQPGDLIDLTLTHVSSNQQTYAKSKHKPVIIYEDQDLLIINKPSGQKTHPNLFETDTALNDCAFYLDANPFIVHRLDMLTSGLLLVAKNPAVVPILNRQLTSKTFHRDYYAWVKAGSLPDHGTIDLPIGQDPNDQRKRLVDPTGRPAITHYQLLSSKNGLAKYQISLETGRTHQIRVHLAAMGAPIIGDPLYNPDCQPGEKLQLTAYQMEFVKPYTFNRLHLQLPN